MDKDKATRQQIVFENYRKLKDKLEDIENRHTLISVERTQIREEYERTGRLINVMVKYDCCPVEAQFSYEDEIDINRNHNHIGGSPISSSIMYDEEEPMSYRIKRTIRRTVKDTITFILNI